MKKIIAAVLATAIVTSPVYASTHNENNSYRQANSQSTTPSGVKHISSGKRIAGYTLAAAVLAGAIASATKTTSNH